MTEVAFDPCVMCGSRAWSVRTKSRPKPHDGVMRTATTDQYACGALLVEALCCCDLLDLVVGTAISGALTRLRNLNNLALVCSDINAAAKDLLPAYTHAATRELLHEGSACDIATIGNSARELVCSSQSQAAEVLNLTSRSLGGLECRLLAHGMEQRLLPPTVRVLWLQNNRIDALGLRLLARGLRSEGANGVRSVSLGANAFHKQTRDECADALVALRKAVRGRRVVLRLDS
jgi:hypothetical protein